MAKKVGGTFISEEGVLLNNVWGQLSDILHDCITPTVTHINHHEWSNNA